MNFAKTSFWALIATIARLISQFVVAKLIAVFSGVATFGLFGQFQSFVSLVQLGSGGIISTGVTKYSAQYHDKPELLQKLIYTAISFAFIASLITGILIAIFSHYLSLYIFQNTSYWWIITIFGLTLVGYTLNQLFISIFNGLNQMVKYASIAIVSMFSSILLIGILTYYYHSEGALVGLVLSQLCLFLVGFAFMHKLPVQIKLFRAKICPKQLKKLLAFSLMSVVSAIALPSAQLFLRGYVATHMDWTAVGYWQAILKISDAYLLIITMVISTYALPKYSRIIDKLELKKEVFSVLCKVFPLVVLLAIGIYSCRHLIIMLLFSKQFLSMQNLFAFQLIGDVLKVSSWCMANVLLAKARVKAYIFLELGFTLTYVITSILGFNLFGLEGLTMSFAFNYLVYFIAVLIWFLRFIRKT